MHIEEPLRAGAVHGAALWDTCLDALARELPEQQFNTWIKPLSAQLSADPARLTLYVGNRFKLATPGPYTFILEATKEVPRRVSHPSRKTIGLRVPDRKGLQMLIDLHGAPLLATTLIPPGETEPLNDAQEIRQRYEHQIDAVIDAGACPFEPTTVIDLTPMGSGGDPVVLREGRGSLSAIGL